MNIKETFLSLTSETYPHGTEKELFHLLPSNLETDQFGNLFIEIGISPSTMFTSHLDTASYEKKKVNHIFRGNIVGTDGTSILGADDKAGVTIMLYMIQENIPGLYYFFLGEERGCIGSKKVADLHKNSPLPNIKKVISFDRRDNGSIITFQSSQRCCSNKFATALAEELNQKSKKEKSSDLNFNYNLDPTGIYTDSYQFISIYPECTNISVGYQNEHTGRETQDLEHLEKLAKTCVLINWENLPVERNNLVQETEDIWEYGNSTDSYFNNISKMWNYEYKPKQEKFKKIWFIDNDYGKHISYIEVDEKYKVHKVDLSRERIQDEMTLIKKTFKSYEIDFEDIDWNGNELTINYGENHTTTHSRKDIEEFIEELSFWTIYIR